MKCPNCNYECKITDKMCPVCGKTLKININLWITIATIIFIIIMSFADPAKSSSYSQNTIQPKNQSLQTNKTNTTGVNWAPYMRNVEKTIRSKWKPTTRSETSKRTVVMFVIGKDGSLLSNKIKQSSGDASMDKAALRAVMQAAPFEPLPVGFNGVSVPIEFTFDYNVRKPY